MNIKKKSNLALVLSGGSARGLGHIGVLDVLEENHIPIDAIVGTSMGALIGGLYAAGVLNDFKKEIIHLSENKIMAIFLAKRIKRMNSDVKTDIGPFLYKFIKDKKIEDLGIRYTAIATDLKTGKEVYINKGSLLKAILASICIPGIFQPVEFGNKILVDGGVVDPLPQTYGHMIAEKVIAVNAMPKKYKYKKNEDGVVEVLSEASSIMSNTLLTLKNIMGMNTFGKKKFVFIQLNTENIGPYDFERGPEIIEIGKKAAKKNISKIIKLVKDY